MHGVSDALFAAEPDAIDKALQSPQFWVTVGLLVVVLLGGAVVLYFTDLWRKRQDTPDRESAESLTSFRALYERGEITDGEYQRIKAKTAAKLRAESSGHPPGAPPKPPAGGTTVTGVDPAAGTDGAAAPPAEPTPG